MSWWLKVLYVVDKAANILTFGKKWETISSRMGSCLASDKCPRVGKAVSRALCGALNLIDRNHCQDAIERARVARLRYEK